MKRWQLSTVYTASQMALGVLVAISIPIFTSQLEKAREAVDQSNLRSVYAEISADLLTEPKADDDANATDKITKITYTAGTGDSGDTYSATVTATQNDTSKWTSGDVSIGGKNVAAAASWTVSGNTKTGVVTITPAGSASN